MDDTVMTDYNSMSITDIQNFLNSKVPSCDTGGTQRLDSSFSASGVPDYNNDGIIQRWEWGKKKYNQTTFPCLRNYTQGGKSSAQIIYEVSQEFHINPKVLIVLLQKEQGLVTDTWPLNIQYKTATGYGCPDSGSCDTKYYGLAQQLTWAATMFHTIVTGSSSWSNDYGSGTSWYTPYTLGNNSIYWNPSTSCGTSTVNILNRTTVALYSYTPYRPNQVALDAGYGSGNSCSSYGNRNFYLYFTDWFGSTTISLFKISGGSATVYLSYGDSYYAIPSSSAIRAWGLQGQKITTINSSQLSSLTQGPSLDRIVKFGSDATVYLVDQGYMYPAPSWSLLNAYGYSSGDLKSYSDVNLKSMLNAQSSLTALARQSDGSIYFVDTGAKHIFPNPSTFSTKASLLAGTTQYRNFSDDLINSIPNGYPILLDGATVKASDGASIYLYDNDKLWGFTPDSWTAWGKKLDFQFSKSSLASLESGGTTPLLITDGTNNYIVSGGKKYKFSDTDQTKWGLDDVDFQQVSAQSLSRLTNGSGATTLVREPSGGVYVVDGGERIGIPSMADFNGLGLNWSNVLNLSNQAINLVPNNGKFSFTPGSLIRMPSGGVYVINGGDVAYTIPSMDMFNSYGFSWKKVRNFNTSALAGYTTQALARLIQTPDNKYYLADSGKLLLVSTAAYGSSQYNFTDATKTTLSAAVLSGLKKSGSLTQFVKGSGATVYKIMNGQKRPIASPTALTNNGGSWAMVTRVSDSFLATLTTGSTLN